MLKLKQVIIRKIESKFKDSKYSNFRNTII